MDTAPLLAALRRRPDLADLDAGALDPLPGRGTAHGHVRIARMLDGIPLLARIPYAWPGDPDAAARLARQAEVFRRAAPAGVTPRLVAALPPEPGLPGGALLVEAIDGRPPRLPAELDAMAATLAALHALPLPQPAARLPLDTPARPLAALAAAVAANAAFIDRLALQDDSRAALSEEMAWLRGWAAAAADDAAAPRTLILADTHPGNFVVEAGGRAVFVDLEKAYYGPPPIDLAHATLPTSTVWDPAIGMILPREAVLAFYRAYGSRLPGAARARLRPWLLPLRRATWLRTMAFFARWLVQTRSPRDRHDPTQWSDAGLDPDMRAHVIKRATLAFEPGAIAAVRADWRGDDPLPLADTL